MYSTITEKCQDDWRFLNPQSFHRKYLDRSHNSFLFHSPLTNSLTELFKLQIIQMTIYERLYTRMNNPGIYWTFQHTLSLPFRRLVDTVEDPPVHITQQTEIRILIVPRVNKMEMQKFCAIMTADRPNNSMICDSYLYFMDIVQWFSSGMAIKLGKIMLVLVSNVISQTFPSASELIADIFTGARMYYWSVHFWNGKLRESVENEMWTIISRWRNSTIHFEDLINLMQGDLFIKTSTGVCLNISRHTGFNVFSTKFVNIVPPSEFMLNVFWMQKKH